MTITRVSGLQEETFHLPGGETRFRAWLVLGGREYSHVTGWTSGVDEQRRELARHQARQAVADAVCDDLAVDVAFVPGEGFLYSVELGGLAVSAQVPAPDAEIPPGLRRTAALWIASAL